MVNDNISFVEQIFKKQKKNNNINKDSYLVRVKETNYSFEKKKNCGYLNILFKKKKGVFQPKNCICISRL